MEQEVDLERMKQLLDGFNEDEKKKEKIRYNYAKSLCTQEEDEFLQISYEDMCMLFNDHGTIAGCSNKIKHEDLYDDILAHLTPEALQSAKGCIIMYIINPDEPGFSFLADSFEKIANMLSDKISFQFGTKTSSSIDKGWVEYRFILAGCKQKNQMNTKFIIDDKIVFIDSQFFTIEDKQTSPSIEQFFEIQDIVGVTYEQISNSNELIDLNIILKSYKYKMVINKTKTNLIEVNSLISFLKKQKRFIKISTT